MYTRRSKIPVTELNRIEQISLSAETTVALLNEMESLYSNSQKICVVWKECQFCHTIFLTYKKATGSYCSQTCCGKMKNWLKNYSNNGLGKKNPKKALHGEKNPFWKGGETYRNRKGNYSSQKIKYVRCPEKYKVMARKDGYVMEHRLLIAQQINRPLLRAEVVHHKNHNAEDNRLENLMLFATNKEHKLFESGKPIQPLWQP